MRMIEVRTIEETHDGRSAVNEIEEGMVYKVLLDEGAVGGARGCACYSRASLLTEQSHISFVLFRKYYWVPNLPYWL